MDTRCERWRQRNKMMNHPLTTHRDGTVGLLAAIACLFPSLPVWADANVAMSNETTYSYVISHVPDLDQKRATLPGAGLAFCVPTAALNWMAYFANHGADWLPPGPGNWLDPARYNEMTSYINAMGDLMGTHPEDGTDGNGAMSGLIPWLGAPFQFTVSQYYTSYSWSPGFQDISMHVLNGAYVMVGVGWYIEFKFEPGLIQRAGGHELSLVSGIRSGDAMEIGWRDPASDEGLNITQSSFTTESYALDRRNVMPETGNWPARYMDKVMNYGSGYIDSFIAIYPNFLLTSSPDMFWITGAHAIRLFGSANDASFSFPTGFGTPLIDLVIHADLGSYLYLAEAAVPIDPAQLWQLNPVTGESTLIDIPLSAPSDVLVGRLRGVYVLDGDDVVCINIDVEEPDEIARITPAIAIAAMTYDDAADELLLLSVDDRALLRYPHHLDAEPIVNPIPAIVPLGGRAAIAWDTVHNSAWVVSDGSDSLFQLTVNPFTGEVEAAEVSHPQLLEPKAIDVNDGGHIFVSSQEQILEFEFVVETGEWQLVEDPIYAGVVAGEFLQIAKSHTNYDPATHGGEAWHHVLPDEFGDEIEDCPADVDGSGDVGVTDFLAVLAAWGPCPPGEFCHEDFDYSGDVNVVDFLQVLAEWGPCP